MDLKIFSNEKFGKVRTVLIEGKIYFIGIDIAKSLGYSNASKAVLMHCKKIKKTMIESPSQNGNMVKTQTSLIPEGDVYRLIMKSKLESAQEFESWVMDEVLPSIRQTGGYIPINNEMSDAEIMAKALMIAQETINKKDELIKNIQPKADWFDKFINGDGVYTSTQVAKLFKISSGRKLNSILNENKIIYKQGKSWMPYANIDKSWFKMIVGSNDDYNYSQLKITPTGIIEISKILNIDITEDDINNIA